MNYLTIFILLIEFLIIYSINIDFNELIKLLIEEKQMMTSLKNYIQSEELNLKTLKEFINKFDEIENNLENPIDVYLAIKRMAVQWPTFKSSYGSKNVLIENLNNSYFSKVELSDAANSLAKLTVMYNLDIKSLVEGIIKYNTKFGEQKTINSNKTLDALDCYLIGRHTYLNSEHSFADQWFNEAIKRSDDQNYKLKARILEMLSLNSYKLGHKYKSYGYLQQSLSLFDNEVDDDFDSIITFKNILNNENEISFEDFLKLISTKEDDNYQLKKTRIINELCRGELNINPKIESKLFCYYLNTSKIPVLKLVKIRVEELNKRPQILFFHKFLSENEINLLKDCYQLKRLEIYDRISDKKYVDSSRVGEGKKLFDNQSIGVTTISQRIADITQMDLSTAEPFNLIRYRVGGFYRYHFDATPFNRESNFNRIATWINYLNDVESGGATYFPLLNLTIFPEKGSALLWFNYKSSGESDSDLFHGGCPVLFGHKWIATKWIHLEGQEFKRPCSIDQNALNYV